MTEFRRKIKNMATVLSRDEKASQAQAGVVRGTRGLATDWDVPQSRALMQSGCTRAHDKPPQKLKGIGHWLDHFALIHLLE